ncbi:unnamed protein product [Clonostachys solani]|uniref:Uncharacterized protein n=1 Tax=Clonostachys solani TaxID=160281 RepID=A0A9N9ZE78_9HYPO|nr:unnamed protein product [Clonostachys solani]
MHSFFRSQFLNFETIRILGTAAYGGAEVAEVLEAVGQIRENDPDSWRAAWSRQAELAEKTAEDARLGGHGRAARRAFLRASNYTRASAYMMVGDGLGESDPRTCGILRKSGQLFNEALALFDHPVRPLEIPYTEDTSLPAYLYLPAASKRLPGGKTPLIINFIGADSIQEEIFYMFPAEGPELGYAVLTVEGPGHGLMLHQHGIPMCPNWEEVVGKAVMGHMSQYAEQNKDLGLDMDRVVVAGASLGAYFALRTAADPRCKACVAVDPIYDLWEFAAKRSGPAICHLWKQGWVPDGVMNTAMSLSVRLSWETRWQIYTSARFLGAQSPVEILRAMQKFTLGGGYLDKVTCPVLVTGGADALYTDAQSDTALIFDQLSNASHKELWVGPTPGQGSLQAKMGALPYCNQRVFAFLDGRFGVSRG